MNLEKILKPRNVKKWEKFGHIVIRFEGLDRDLGHNGRLLSSPPLASLLE